jgi:hypothetical protein
MFKSLFNFYLHYVLHVLKNHYVGSFSFTAVNVFVNNSDVWIL